MASALLISRN